MEETAGTGGKLASILEADRGGEGCPRGVGEGVGNPLVAAINVVFDDNKVSSGFKVAHELTQDGFFVTVEV